MEKETCKNCEGTGKEYDECKVSGAKLQRICEHCKGSGRFETSEIIEEIKEKIGPLIVSTHKLQFFLNKELDVEASLILELKIKTITNLLYTLTLFSIKEEKEAYKEIKRTLNVLINGFLGLTDRLSAKETVS